MNVKFEIGKESVYDQDGYGKPEKVVATKVDKVEATGNVGADANVNADEEKAKLQAILTEAGVEFNPKLGVAKLQALVDELPTQPE